MPRNDGAIERRATLGRTTQHRRPQVEKIEHRRLNVERLKVERSNVEHFEHRRL